MPKQAVVLLMRIKECKDGLRARLLENRGKRGLLVVSEGNRRREPDKNLSIKDFKVRLLLLNRLRVFSLRLRDRDKELFKGKKEEQVA